MKFKQRRLGGLGLCCIPPGDIAGIGSKMDESESDGVKRDD
jgi:hypothetical protein